MPIVFQRWWADPVASSSLTIAIVAGVFAVYQLRAIPRERRRRVLDAMVQQYGKTTESRKAIANNCPIFFELAYAELKNAVDDEIQAIRKSVREGDAETAAMADLKLRHLERLKKESHIWAAPHIGISYTSASEILASEFKVRALIWCIETLRDPAQRQRADFSELLHVQAQTLVNELNNFALDYENGTYPPRTLFGQLHRSIAPIAKALEPIIWEGSIKGRWGRRVLRLGLAAQHFNDVVKIHRSNDLTWFTSPEKEVIIHPAKTKEIFGKEILRNDLPTAPRFLPILRLQAVTFYWSIIGRLAFRPTSALWAFGGLRLRRHTRQEDHLSAFIRFALRHAPQDGSRFSTSFAWNLDDMRHEMVRASRSRRTAVPGGRLAWLYVRRSQEEN